MMTTRTKTTLVLIGTFVMGMILGAVLSNVYMHQKHEKVRRSMRSPDWVAKKFEKIVEPTAEQREAMRMIFENHHQKMIKYQKDFPLHMDTLKQEIDAILTEEQRQKLKDNPWLFKDRHSRRNIRNKDSKRGHRPPPPEPDTK